MQSAYDKMVENRGVECVKQTNALTEGAMAAALFAVLLFLFVYMPIVNIVVMWVLPLPFIVYVLRNGWQRGLFLWAVSFVIALIVANVAGLFVAFMFGAGGLVVGVLYRQKRSAFAVLLGGSLAYTASLIVVFIISTVLMGFNFVTESVQLLKETITAAEQMAEGLGDEASSRFEGLREQAETLRYLAPMFIVVTGVLYAFVIQLVSVPVLRRLKLGEYVKAWVPFREWRFPKSFLWYYLIILLVAFFQDFTPGSPLFIVYINLFLILQWVLVIQGFSFVFFFLHVKQLHRLLGVVTVIVSLLFWWVMQLVIMILGIMDLGFDLRERLRSPS